MCKDNTIVISWSWIGAIIGLIFLGGGIIATWFGIHLTWGQIVFLPFILTFFANHKHRYTFTDSGFTEEWMIRRRTVSVREIKQVNILSTKSGTWIVIELYEAPPLPRKGDPVAIFSYCLRNRRKSFLLPLRWGEREKALEILRGCYPQKIVIVSP